MMRYSTVIVLLFLVLAGCGQKEQQEFTKNQQRILGYIPPDVQTLLYVNISGIKKSGHWGEILKTTVNKNSENWLSDFEKKTGAGLGSGISELYTCSTWEGNDLIIVTLNEKQDKVRSYFSAENGFETKQVSGKAVYKLAEKDGPDFYFPDASTIIIAKNETYLTRLIEGNNQSLKNNKKFYSQVNKINLKHHYWMSTSQGSYAASIINLLLGTGRDIPGKELVESIDNISLAAEFSDDVMVESVLGCKDEKSAYLISAALRSAVAMDLFSNMDSRLGSIMKDLDVERESNTLNLELLLNKKDILQLKELSKNRLTDKNL